MSGKRHPMYTAVAGDSLRQGDVLDRDKIRDLLVGHQDWFASKEYFTGFCVVTQTCDLVRSNDPLPREPNADFLHLAVVRSIYHAFSAHVVATNADSLRDSLGKIINHAWNDRAYFYLHPDDIGQIGEPSVVDLRVMFSLDRRRHYDQLLAARKVSLEPIFATKLGWMTGHLFSRIATPDWRQCGVDPDNPKAYVKQLTEAIKAAEDKAEPGAAPDPART